MLHKKACQQPNTIMLLGDSNSQIQLCYLDLVIQEVRSQGLLERIRASPQTVLSMFENVCPLAYLFSPGGS